MGSDCRPVSLSRSLAVSLPLALAARVSGSLSGWRAATASGRHAFGIGRQIVQGCLFHENDVGGMGKEEGLSLGGECLLVSVVDRENGIVDFGEPLETMWAYSRYVFACARDGGDDRLHGCARRNSSFAPIREPPHLVYALLRHVGCSPPEQRVNRIMSASADDLSLMDPGSFRTVIEIQLALQHVRKRTPFPHRVCLGRVVDLLVGAAGPRLSTEHPLVRQALESMNVRRKLLNINVTSGIPHLQRAWRQESVDGVCIRNLLLIFSDFHEDWIEDCIRNL